MKEVQNVNVDVYRKHLCMYIVGKLYTRLKILTSVFEGQFILRWRKALSVNFTDIYKSDY